MYNTIKPLRSVHILTKPIGALCNLNCTYCYYLDKEKLYPQDIGRMPAEILKAYIRQRIESESSPVVSFAWQGGEPTLPGIGFFKNVLALQKEYANGKRIDNSLQTNGVLLNDEWCAFFSENNFLIGVSIDGPEELHNLYRLNKKGQGTFAEVMRGIGLLKKHEVQFNTLTAVHKENARQSLEVYHFLKEMGSHYIQFIPVVERISKGSGKLISVHSAEKAVIAEWSVDADQYGNFLIKIFDEWVRNDVAQRFIQIFDVALESWFGVEQNLCLFQPVCGMAPALEHNGDLYQCDHFVFPENKLGNIMENSIESLYQSPQQFKFGMDKKDSLPQYCLKCDVRFACNGGCPKNRFIAAPDGEPGLNYLCSGYKNFFNHIDPHMRFMANELRHQRSPANVMDWNKKRDKNFPHLLVKEYI